MSQTVSVPTAPVMRQIAFLPLVGIIFANVAGGPYGLEGLYSSSGPGLGLLLLIVAPLIYGAPIAAITSELSVALPEDGGTYAWARRTMGRFMGFQAGFLRWVQSWVDMALYVAIFSGYLAAFFPIFANGETVLFTVGPVSVDLYWLIGFLCVIVPMGILNLFSSRTVGDSTLVFALVSITPGAAIAAIGIWHLVTQGINPVTPFVPEGTTLATGLTVGLSLVMWSYSAFDQVGLISGEVKNPARIIPRAMTLAMFVIVLVYSLPLIGSMAVPGWETWEAGSFVEIAHVLGGPVLQIVVVIGGMTAAISSYSSLLLTRVRAPFALARDGWLPPVLARQSRRSGSPWVAVIVSSAIYAVFSLSSFSSLVIIDVFLINVLLLFNLAAFVLLRIREPELPRPVRLPWGWFGVALVSVPLIASITFVIWLWIAGDPVSALVSIFVTFGFTTAVFFVAQAVRRRNARRLDATDPAGSDVELESSTSP